MLKRKKQIIAKVMATTMLASTLATAFTPEADASELQTRASVSEASIAGNNRYQTAVEISKNYSSTSKHAVIVNGQKGIVDALSATPYASLKKAPILMTESDKLNADTKAELLRLNIKTVDIVGGSGSVSEPVKAEIEAMGITVNRIWGKDKYATSLAVAKEIDKIYDISKIAVVSGEGLADAVSVAAPAAQNKMPIILAHPTNGLDAETKEYIDGENISTSYVIGGTSSVLPATQNSLPGTKERLSGGEGTGRAETNAAVVKKFYPSSSYDNVYVAKSGQVVKADEIADALALGVLAASKQDPVILVGKSLGSTQKTLLEGKEVDKITTVGNGIPTASINAIKNTQKEEVKEESKVSSVTVVDNKTIYLNGSDLDLIGKSNISLSGNTVSSYSVNTSGTKATVVFNYSFTSGVSNTIKVTSNLYTTTNHTFIYKEAVTIKDITSVEAPTKEVGTEGIQYLELTVNGGQKITIEELKTLGWSVQFRSDEDIFYEDQNNTLSETNTSETGQLRTTYRFAQDEIYNYEVVLRKGTKELFSGMSSFTARNKNNDVKSIDSKELIFDTIDKLVVNPTPETQREFYSNTLLVGEEFKISKLNVTNLTGSKGERTSGYTVQSSNTDVITPGPGGVMKAQNTGTSTITIKMGDVTTSFTVTVKDNASNTRVAKTAKFSPTSVSLVEGNSKDITITILDQFGDPVINPVVNGVSLITLPTEIKSSAKGTPKIAETTGLSRSVEDIAKGQFKTTINAISYLEKSGSGSLKVQYNGKDLTGSLSVSVTSDIADPANYTKKLEIDGNSISKDLTIDKYTRLNDNSLTIVVNQYKPNTTAFADILDISSGYTVELSKENVVTTTINNKRIIISPIANGANESVTLTLYKNATDTTAKTKIGSSITIKVQDNTPTISTIQMKDIEKIVKFSDDANVNMDNAKAVAEFRIQDLFDIKKAKTANGNDKLIVSDVTLKGIQLGNKTEVLLDLFDYNSAVGSDDANTKNPVLFLDNDENGKYTDGDELLATIVMEVSNGIIGEIKHKVDESCTHVDDTIVGITKNSVYLEHMKQNGTIQVRLYHGEYLATKTPIKDATKTIYVDIPAYQ